MRFSLLRKLVDRKNQPSLRRQPARFRPWLEHLEERVVPAVHDLTTGMSYSTIQGAVNAANPGDTILADAGTYAENVTINKTLTLEGAQHGVDARTRSGAESVVTGAGNGGKTPFYITASDVVLDGFTVQDATDPNQFGGAILIAPGVNGTQVLNNIIQDNLLGIYLENNSSTDQAVIAQNLFRDNTQPGPGSGQDIYADNYSTGATGGTGGLQNVLIKNNTFTNSTFVEASYGIGLGDTDPTHPFSNISVMNNAFSNTGRGMYLYATDNTTVTGNTFTGTTHYAIGAFGAVNGLTITCNTLSGNTVSGTGELYVEDDLGTPGSPDPNSNIHMNYNNIVGNTTNILVSNAGSSPDGYTGVLDATNDWWGSPSGPTPGSIVDNVPGSSVNYTPWLLAPVSSSGSSPGSILLLDPNHSDSLSATGNGDITVTGGGSINVDSSSSEDALAGGNGQVSAAQISVHGTPGTKTTGNGKFVGAVTSGAPVVNDPLSTLATPSQPPRAGSRAIISGHSVVYLKPGTYVGGIRVSGQAVVYLEPGIYYLEGGGLTVTGQAQVLMAPDAASHPSSDTGTGVLIYLASNQATDGITISGQAIVKLQAPTSGIWQGISIFEARTSTAPITVSGSGQLILDGTLYAASAKVNVSGNAILALITKSMMSSGGPCASSGANLIAYDLNVGGNGQVDVETE